MTTVTKQIHFVRKGPRKVARPGPPPKPPEPPGRIPRVSKLMALAIRFEELLRDGQIADQSELACVAHVTQPRMTQIMNLLHLAPDIQEAILRLPRVLEGRDPITERHLRPIVRIVDWALQRDAWAQMTDPRPSAAPHAGNAQADYRRLARGHPRGYNTPDGLLRRNTGDADRSNRPANDEYCLLDNCPKGLPCLSGL